MNHRTLIYSFLLLLFPLVLWAQPKDNSPYSRFGLGDPLQQYFGNAAGMGGLSAGFADPYHINMVNPASYASLRSTAFEVGFNVKYSTLKNNELSENVFSGDLNYMAIAFPVRNPNNEIFDGKKKEVNWGMNLGLQRYTRVGYDIRSDFIEINNDTIVASFRGEGGTYRFFWGNAVSYKNLSVGLNIGTLFGKITNSRNTTFQDDLYFYNNQFAEDQNLTGFLWSAGAQYKIPLKYEENNDLSRYLTVGVYGNATHSFRSNSTQVFEAVNSGYGGARDTSLINVEIEGDGQLPAQFGIGFLYNDVNRLRFGADLELNQWAGYENENALSDVPLENAFRLAAGIEFTPQSNRFKQPEQQIRYRLGGYFEKDARTFNGDQLTNYAVTIGTGIPIIGPRQALSHINLALEAGQFGLDEGVRENYLRLVVGLTLNDNSWFINRKFN